MAGPPDWLCRLGRLQIPGLHGGVPAPGGQIAVVGAESHLPDITSVALQRAQFRVRLGVPDLHGVATLEGARRRDASAVGADGDGGVGVGMVSDLKERLLSGRVPDFEGGIRSAGRRKSAAGVEGQTRYRGRGGLKGTDILSGR